MSEIDAILRHINYQFIISREMVHLPRTWKYKKNSKAIFIFLVNLNLGTGIHFFHIFGEVKFRTIMHFFCIS